MTATISYDRPVTNLIDGLSATGHVTHTSHAKTMVTMHHNGGVNFSHQQILNIWKTRPASAHFDVDSAGAVAQYVKELEYAWACASRVGNETSISIELANATGSPGWTVSETTWKAGCRLAGWLFANVIKARPTSATLVYHSHWYATACAGPHMDSIYAQVLAETQRCYDAFVAAPNTPTPVNPLEDDMFDETDRGRLNYAANVAGPRTATILSEVTAARAELAGLTAAVQTLAASKGADSAAIVAEVGAAVRDRLSQIVVTVAEPGA